VVLGYLTFYPFRVIEEGAASFGSPPPGFFEAVALGAPAFPRILPSSFLLGFLRRAGLLDLVAGRLFFSELFCRLSFQPIGFLSPAKWIDRKFMGSSNFGGSCTEGPARPSPGELFFLELFSRTLLKFTTTS